MTYCVKGKRDHFSLEEPPEKNCMNWALPGVNSDRETWRVTQEREQ